MISVTARAGDAAASAAATTASCRILTTDFTANSPSGPPRPNPPLSRVLALIKAP
jgi:hypothetical protein